MAETGRGIGQASSASLKQPREVVSSGFEPVADLASVQFIAVGMAIPSDFSTASKPLILSCGAASLTNRGLNLTNAGIVLARTAEGYELR